MEQSIYKKSEISSHFFCLQQMSSSGELVLQYKNVQLPLSAEQVAKLRSRSLFIATPCFGGVAYVDFMNNVFELKKVCEAVGVNVCFQHLSGESLINRARNTLSSMFLATNFTHLLFIDSDIRFSPLSVLLMLVLDHPIVGAVYPQKKLLPNELAKLVIAEYKAGGEVAEAALTDPKNPAMDRIMSMALNYNVNIRPNTDIQLTDNGDCAEVLYIATGFMMIQRQVLIHMRDSDPKNTYKNDMVGQEIPESGLPLYDWFPVGVFPNTIDVPLEKRRLLSEDYYFCQRAVDLGYKIHAMTRIPLVHIGIHQFQGCWLEKLASKELCDTLFDSSSSSSSLFAVDLSKIKIDKKADKGAKQDGSGSQN